jgi:hypothetical protein
LPCEGRVESKGAADPRDLSGRKGFVDIPRVFLLVLSDYDSKSLACHSFVTGYSVDSQKKRQQTFWLMKDPGGDSQGAVASNKSNGEM